MVEVLVEILNSTRVFIFGQSAISRIQSAYHRRYHKLWIDKKKWQPKRWGENIGDVDNNLNDSPSRVKKSWKPPKIVWNTSNQTSIYFFVFLSSCVKHFRVDFVRLVWMSGWCNSKSGRERNEFDSQSVLDLSAFSQTPLEDNESANAPDMG